MNNRFKFRAWDCLNTRMVKATSIDFENNMLHFMNEKFKENPTYITYFELMQWTGLKDKNGNEIYEEDIIKAMCEFGPAGFQERILTIRFHETQGYRWNYVDLESIVVIGNTYENSDLLQ